MKSKLNQRFSAGIMFLFITVLFIPALALAGVPGDQRQGKGLTMKGCHGPVLGIWRNPRMVQNLELTEIQVKQIRDIDFTFREKHLVLKAQLDSFHLQLDKAFSNEKIDDAVILKVAQAISEVKGKLFIQNVESRLALGKILTADQIEKMNLYDPQPKRRGPGKGRERMMKMPLLEKPCDEKPFEN